MPFPDSARNPWRSLTWINTYAPPQLTPRWTLLVPGPLGGAGEGAQRGRVAGRGARVAPAASRSVPARARLLIRLLKNVMFMLGKFHIRVFSAGLLTLVTGWGGRPLDRRTQHEILGHRRM
jgi:hypothetical protein